MAAVNSSRVKGSELLGVDLNINHTTIIKSFYRLGIEDGSSEIVERGRMNLASPANLTDHLSVGQGGHPPTPLTDMYRLIMCATHAIPAGSRSFSITNCKNDYNSFAFQPYARSLFQVYVSHKACLSHQ